MSYYPTCRPQLLTSPGALVSPLRALCAVAKDRSVVEKGVYLHTYLPTYLPDLAIYYHYHDYYY